jgi:hypothetical protein
LGVNTFLMVSMVMSGMVFSLGFQPTAGPSRGHGASFAPPAPSKLGEIMEKCHGWREARY